MKTASVLLGFLLATAADVTVMQRPGGLGFADVVHVPGVGFALLHATYEAVIVETPTRVLWQTATPEPLLYLQGAACGVEVRAVGQGNVTGHAYEVGDGWVRVLGTSFGGNATQIACHGSVFYAYVQTQPDAFLVINLADRMSELVAMPATSQGFRDVTADGEIRLGDAWFQRVIRDRSLHLPVERGGVWAGQWSEGPPGIGLILPDRAVTVIPGLGFEPALERDGATFAVAARTPDGATLAIVTPPYPPDETLEPPPRKEVCGNGLDDDGDGLVDEDCPGDPPQLPELPPEVCATLHAERNKYPGDLFAGPCREAGDPACPLGRILNATAWIHRAAGFGLSRKVGGYHVVSPVGPIASDILHREADQAIWDVIIGVGTQISCGRAIAIQHDPSRPFVAPVDPGHDTGPVDPPGEEIAELKRRLAEADARITALQLAVGDLQQAVTLAQAQRAEALGDVERLRARVAELESRPPATCQVTGPGWIRSLFGITCQVVQ